MHEIYGLTRQIALDADSPSVPLPAGLEVYLTKAGFIRFWRAATAAEKHRQIHSALFDFGEFPSTGSGPEPAEGSRGAALWWAYIFRNLEIYV